MPNTDFIDAMVKRLCAAIPPGLQTIQQDLERNFYAILQSAFAKFDLVTRQELDVQAGVLAKTRAKLEALAQQISELEAQLLDNSTKNK